MSGIKIPSKILNPTFSDSCLGHAPKGCHGAERLSWRGVLCVFAPASDYSLSFPGYAKQIYRRSSFRTFSCAVHIVRSSTHSNPSGKSYHCRTVLARYSSECICESHHGFFENHHGSSRESHWHRAGFPRHCALRFREPSYFFHSRLKYHLSNHADPRYSAGSSVC